MSLSYHKYRKALSQWSVRYGDSSLEEIEAIIDKIKSYKDLVDQDKIMVGIFDPTIFRYVYLSENAASFLGYPISKLITDEQIFASVLNLSAESHSSASTTYYPSLIFEYLKNMDAQVNFLPRHSMYVGGLKFEHGKSKKIVTVFIKIKILGYRENGLPALGLHLIEDIGHLMKRNPLWCRCVYGDDNLVRFFTLDYLKEYFDDMVSKRELEVLKMIADNKDSKEISQQLDISKETVQKHRKNMLLRTGAKDSTALIHLCKLCDVLQ